MVVIKHETVPYTKDPPEIISFLQSGRSRLNSDRPLSAISGHSVHEDHRADDHSIAIANIRRNTDKEHPIFSNQGLNIE